MQINSVSASIPSVTSNPRSTTPSPAKPAVVSTASTTSTPPSTTGTPAPAAASPAKPAQPAPKQVVSSAAASLLNSVYSTTVAGKNYSGSIVQSAGQYEISVPNLPGASVSGSSLQAAETALTIKIDTLV